MKRDSSPALVMLIAAVVIWGTLGVFRRYLPLSSGLLACVRGAVGSACLLVWLGLRRKRGQWAFPPKVWALLLFSGALIGVNWMLLFEAYSYTTVATATLCYYMAPVLVILASPLLLRESLPLRKVLCVAVALAGMVCVSGVADNGLPAPGEAKGIAYGLAAAVLYASVVMLNKKIEGVGAYEKTILQLGSAAVVLIPYLAVTEDFSALTLTPFAVGMLLIVGVVHTGVAYALCFGPLGGRPAPAVALFSYIDPVTAIVLSALLLHERMTPFGVLGAVLVLGSTIVSEVLTPKEKTE